MNEAVRLLLKQPEKIGRAVGFKDLTALHGKWIRAMVFGDRKSTRLNSSHTDSSRMPSSA